MKSIYVAILGCCLGPLLGHGQLLQQLSFSSTNGVSNESTGVEFSGIISFYADHIHVEMTNSTDGTAGILTGFAIHKPIPTNQKWLGSGSFVEVNDQLVQHWSFIDGKDAKGSFNGMFGGGNLGNLDHYLIASIHPSKQSWGVGSGDTGEFVFNLNQGINPPGEFYPWLFDNSFEPWTVMARFQSVGDDGEDSDKFYLKSVIYLVPEPSEIAFIGVGLLVIPIGLRRLRAQKRK